MIAIAVAFSNYYYFILPVKEGLSLSALGISPYSGDVVHEVCTVYIYNVVCYMYMLQV